MTTTIDYHIKGNYYFDIDLHNQFRLAGPENHLLLGIPFPKELKLTIGEAELLDSNLIVTIQVSSNDFSFPMPLVSDMRTLRGYVEQAHKVTTYQMLSQNKVHDLLPESVQLDAKKNKLYLKNSYQDNAHKKEYGAIISSKNAQIHIDNGRVIIKGSKPSEEILITIQTLGNVSIENPFTKTIYLPEVSFPNGLIPKTIEQMYHKIRDEIQHLLLSKKTSSFEYGTIFPRDWIESADLGSSDLTQETVEYMYEQSLEHVSESGEGWHENIIGQFKTRFPDERLHIDRKMIDIEPHYLLGLPLFSGKFKYREDIHQKMRRIARFLIHNSSQFHLITFKKREESPEEYHHIGNWRDSFLAFPQQKAPLAPYDVNCVFYPSALRVIRDNYDYFDIQLEIVNPLIEKWDTNKRKYRMYHDDLLGYSLALHGKKRQPLPISHLDESYDLFYGNPSLEEVVSFARKIIDPEYFYTPAGPILVSRDDENFSTKEYHGKVIWPKQVAFAVAGLTRQYFKGLTANWPDAILDELKKAVEMTAEASFQGWSELNAVPELYYYDEVEDRARLYTDQENYEGQMSLIQLWSAVGCRRIIRDYLRIKGHQLTQEKI